MNSQTVIIKGSRNVDDLKPGQIIEIDAHFFPEEETEDSVLFISERLTVVEVNEDNLIVETEHDFKVCMPVEKFRISKGEARRIKSPVRGVPFYIYALYDNIGEGILAGTALGDKLLKK